MSTIEWIMLTERHLSSGNRFMRFFGRIVNTVGIRETAGFMWLIFSLCCGTLFFVLTKTVLSGLDLFSFLTWWYGYGLIFHSLYGLKTRGVPLRDILNDHPRVLLMYHATDIVGTISFFSAIRLMDPSISSFLNQSQAILALFLGWLFLKETLTRGEVGASVVIIFGVTVMTFKSVAVPFAGFVWMMVANLAAAMNLVIIRRFGTHLGAVTFARLRSTVLFILFVVWVHVEKGAVTVPPLSVIVMTGFGAFFGPFANTLAIYKTLEFIPAGKYTLFKSAQPLTVTVAAAFVLGSIPGPRELLGGFIVIGGCLLLAGLHARSTTRNLPLRSPNRQ